MKLDLPASSYNPAIIVTLLLSICLITVVQGIELGRQRQVSLGRDMGALSELLVQRLEHARIARSDASSLAQTLQKLLLTTIPKWGYIPGRYVVVFDGAYRL